jgi:two-component system, OmpR family, sensor histidine kinase ChvG
MRLIAAAKRVAKRHWPALSIRTILLATFLFVAALPGVGAVALRVYENTLVQQTEAELIAQGAVLAAAYRAAWGDRLQGEGPLAPEPPTIDLRSDPVLPAMPEPVPAGAADPRAMAVGQALAPVMHDAAAVTLSSARLLDGAGIIVAGGKNLGLSFAGVPEVRRALGGQVATTLRTRVENPYGMHSPLEWLSRAVTIRVHHVRPVVAGGRVVGVVMLSRSPRGLFVGIYQDRGKIAVGVVLIFLTLLVLAGLLSRGIARPIRELTRATEKVSRGEVAIPNAPATAAIEIRELYAHFATMAERIDIRARYLRDFAAAVSHEFKTPLAGIRGALELLGEHEMTRDESRRFLANAGADADRLALLVQRLLEMARADMATVQGGACDLGVVIAGLGDTGVSITVIGEGGEVPIDAETLATILSILLENSRQAGAGAVTLQLDRDPEVATIRYLDDGPGVPPGDRDRIFTPFFTSRREQGGTGLGLPIAHSLLSAAGGSVGLVFSAEGAAFLLTLPVRG